MEKVALIVPCYNVLPWENDLKDKLQTLSQDLAVEFKAQLHLILVDDGSTRPGSQVEFHAENLKNLAWLKFSCTKHKINRGQGAALMTALRLARRSPIDADYFVTFDADGQHEPNDVMVLLRKLKSECLDIVFGNRFALGQSSPPRTPPGRKLLLKLAVIFERWLTGLKLGDAHNGFRLFNKKTAQLLNIRQDRMAHATEIKQQVNRFGLLYGEAPVNISYDSKYRYRPQSSSNAINILQELFKDFVFK